jgi:hypothetical protein
MTDENGSGYMFLSDFGNIYRYETRSSDMDHEIYISGHTNNILSLHESEKIIEIENYNAFHPDMIRFTTNHNRYLYLYNLDETINNHEEYVFDYDIFSAEEDLVMGTMDWDSDTFFFASTQNRVLAYNLLTNSLQESSFFPINEGETIIALHYGRYFSKYYVTDNGILRYWNNNGITTKNFRFDIELDQDETIVSYDRTWWSCRSQMALISTSQDKYYLTQTPLFSDTETVLEVTPFVPQDLLTLDSNDVIESIKIADFSTNTCGGELISYNTLEFRDLYYILEIQTTQHAYMIGFPGIIGQPGEPIVLQIY